MAAVYGLRRPRYRSFGQTVNMMCDVGFYRYDTDLALARRIFLESETWARHACGAKPSRVFLFWSNPEVVALHCFRSARKQQHKNKTNNMSSKHRLTRSFRTLSAISYLVSISWHQAVRQLMFLKRVGPPGEVQTSFSQWLVFGKRLFMSDCLCICNSYLQPRI